jgi:hypothetical protein
MWAVIKGDELCIFCALDNVCAELFAMKRPQS